LLKSLRRRLVLALGAGLLAGVVAAAVTWYAMPASKYTAAALLQIASIPPKVIFATNESRVEFSTYQKNQMSLIRSRLVLSSALKDPKVQKLGAVRRQVNPYSWLEKELQAECSGEMMRVFMNGSRPDDLAAIVNAVADAYLREVVNVETNERRKRYDDLQKIYRTYQTRLEVKRATLKQLAERVGSKDDKTVRLTHEYALDRLETARKELAQVRSDLRKDQTQLAVLETRRPARPNMTVPASVIALAEEDEPAIFKWKALIKQLEQKRAGVQRVARSPSDAAMLQVNQQLRDAQRSLEQWREKVRSDVAARYRAEVRDERDQEVEAIRLRVQVLKELERLAADDVKVLSEETGSINRGSMDLESIRDEIAHAETAEKKIGDELEVLNVELHAPPRVKLFEAADAPRREEDNRKRTSGIVGLGALAMVLLGVAWLEFRSRRIDSVDDVVHQLQIPLVGVLPPLSRRALPAPSAGASSRELSRQQHFIESIDAIRATMLHAGQSRPPRVVMVTSAVAREGKTSLTSLLASSLARGGRKTLVIDCDLRVPAVHRLFGMSPSPGFSELLRGEAGIDEVARPSPVAGLWVIPAGEVDHRAIQALDREHTRALFHTLRERFDFVVVDTSPVLPVADALLVGLHVDAAIYSILRDVSRAPAVAEADARLSQIGIPVLGAVVCGVRTETYAGYPYPKTAEDG
jgi:capsular exopolysaccharide synthesis family protein